MKRSTALFLALVAVLAVATLLWAVFTKQPL